MRHKYTIKAKAALHKSQRHNLDDDDWDQRPESICKGCGYSKKNCTCSVQKPSAKRVVINSPSIDFYHEI